MKAKNFSVAKIIINIFLLIGIVAVSFPFVWMILSSVKSTADFYSFSFWPQSLDFSGYKFVFEKTDFTRWYLNSFIVAIVVTFSNIIFCSLIGYTLAKFRVTGMKLIFLIILSTMMIPTEMLIIPWYVFSSDFQWVDSYWGLIFPGLMEAFGIFLMRQFMASVPDDILDAARIDGMGEFKIWLRIAMPQVKPAISALAIITFLGNWNAYLWPVIVTNTAKMRTLPVGIAMYGTSDAGGIQWNTIMAMSSLTVIPMIIVFLIFQRQIVEGIALSGTKG